jgi:hypothetical protein
MLPNAGLLCRHVWTATVQVLSTTCCEALLLYHVRGNTYLGSYTPCKRITGKVMKDLGEWYLYIHVL